MQTHLKHLLMETLVVCRISFFCQSQRNIYRFLSSRNISMVAVADVLNTPEIMSRPLRDRSLSKPRMSRSNTPLGRNNPHNKTESVNQVIIVDFLKACFDFS
jgi:hypothetical protein